MTAPVISKTIFRLLLFVLLVLNPSFSFAKEGMWLPPNLPGRAADMRAMGLEIPISELFNEQGTGLNNAVVLFGKGCTGEIISGEGLVLTNHHCGYSAVQGLSSPAHDYFAAGFWAMNKNGEMPCPGLTVTFVRQMENVTGKITAGLPDTMAEASRDSILAARIAALEKGYRYTTHLDAVIQPFYSKNQYWVIVTETFKDIRLVGFPPNGIGFFGGDTDNWMWPRHNGDFSLFRVYASAANKPADYNKANKPYKPKRFFPINISGYKEGDFTMVYGFPGTTQEYISSPQLAEVAAIADPVRIDIRTRRLAIWDKAMAADRSVFLKYTSKHGGLANGWKKWQGEVRGLRVNNVIGRKEDYERGFAAWANADTTLPFADNILAQIQAVCAASYSALKADEYMREAVTGVELIQQGAALDALLRTMRSKDFDDNKRQASLTGWKAFFKNYDATVDEEIFDTLMPLYFRAEPAYVPADYRFSLAANGGDFNRWGRHVFATSLVADSGKMQDFISGATAADTARILSDPAWQLYHALAVLRAAQVAPLLSLYAARMPRLNRLYLEAQMAKDSGSRAFYPDANLTLRLAYGRIHGIDPEGPAGYAFQTNVDEIMAKDNPASDEFRVPQKLKDLVALKDYGRWSVNGTVPVAFLADNHTSGGNSGSPVLNARGELIGTNFDRVWEGTMSDLYFDPNLCRNISVDIRYTLFIIEKFGGAGWLLREMKLVKN